MRLEQLQAFLAVAETGNFQQAAQKCGVSQSTISRQVQSLEATVGLSLFHRQGNAKLTLGGDRLLPHAKKICQIWATAEQELTDLQAGKQTELCVAGIPSACAYQLPPILQKFSRTYPNVQLRVTTLGSDRALKVLKDGLIDIAIVMNNPFLTASSEMVITRLYEEKIQLLLPAQHPLSKKEIITWRDLDNFPQAVFKDGYGLQRLVQDQFNRQGIRLNAALELNALEAFRGVVKQGSLIALLPETFLVELNYDPDLVVRSLGEPSLTREIVLVTTIDRIQIPPIQYFCKLAAEMVQREIPVILKSAFTS
ncbi:MAG: LysR family transcriptional regulator [Pseudanabaena sp.]|jgi:DNA-binding transcriptional LysR family regulator|uniref:LysR family transcriptional regulator n=1 Tax=Pseudanabaena mucicola TaxID=71190 RepID=UPI00257655EC|nr:LysR family transcriptional regulator [Pseudanabaena mucicola]MCA6573675.1 LysR family transcriptional regulator [Pseudanabaena sp. M53BS1SP1A06MG]MCA6582034.1 LysR family transcriptional regulator [Pseudanabaena sp. M34BS1SP1A06MG]MCA6590059.1 LysR family transcriptional regulator [Pseudanabaena sp. M109S1SP1A06QC]MCA6593777.1 LysR family transcriptional regulator [Pseudanabaena sp. M38BS1SP1A06MG]MCA6596818.1 LysR family transcriptional regulator [Pseudanabaena sp. M046S1SP1A06QC]MCA6598